MLDFFLDIRAFLREYAPMNGKEFIRKVRKLGRKTGHSVRLVPYRGKGGHQTLFYGERHTIVQTGEIPTGTFRAMCRQLGINPKDL